MNVQLITGLVVEWRADAGRFRVLGYDSAARHAERYAMELEERLRAWEGEALDLEAAAKESGFTYSALQKRLRRGDLPNAGRAGSPRIRRCDLPSKGGQQIGSTQDGDPDLAAMVLRPPGEG